MVDFEGDHPDTIAVLGCGRMGRAIVRAFAAAGVRACVWNRTHASALRLEGTGVRAFERLPDAMAGATIAVAAPVDYAALYEIIDQHPMGEGVWPTLVNLATGSAADAAHMAALARERGIDYIDGSIWALPEQIGLRDTCIAFAGPEGAWQRSVQLLDILGGANLYLGQHIEAPNVLEAAFPGAFYIMGLASAAEAFAMARALGVSDEDCLAAAGAALRLLDRSLPNMFLAGDETQRAEQSTIDICRNAIVQYQPSYDAAGTSQDLAQALLKMLQQASDRGLGGSSPFRLVEAMTKGL